MMQSKQDGASQCVASPEGGVGVRLRAIVLGLLFAAVICAITPFNNIYRQGTPLGGGHFPLAPFFILIWLTFFAALARRLFKSWTVLTGKELLLVWVLMVLVSGIAYTGLARTFFVNLTAPYHFASVENRWEKVLHPLLPGAWYPHGREAINAVYNGLPGGRQMGWIEVIRTIPWVPWMKPLLIWSGFIFLSFFLMICIVNLLSRQALYNERMNFPLLQVPQLMEDAFDQGEVWRFLTDRFFVVGLTLPVFLHLINGLHFYFPVVPQIPTLILAGSYFPDQGLFSGLSRLNIHIYPAFIGFAFLASKQVSFSFWFLFLLGGLVVGLLGVLGYNIPAASLGVTFGPSLPRPVDAQMIGAYLIFFLFLLWLARYHFLDIIKKVFYLKEKDEADVEWFSLRFSFWGALLGSVSIAGWFWYFGMPIMVSVLTLSVFFLFMLVASRIICQGGVAYFTLTAAPLDVLLVFFGPQFFTKMGIVMAAVTQKVLFVDLRESLMPSLLHARKVTQGISGRRLVIAGILITLIMAVALSFLSTLALCYKYGIQELQMEWATRTTVTVYENIFSLVEAPVRPGRWVLIFSALGAATMLILVVCYHRVSWWPLHPLGYLTAYSSAMRILWFSFLLGWLANALCIRYGGVILFKNFRYFFVGLIVGDFLMGGTWAIVGLFARGSYLVLPD